MKGRMSDMFSHSFFNHIKILLFELEFYITIFNINICFKYGNIFICTQLHHMTCIVLILILLLKKKSVTE